MIRQETEQTSVQCEEFKFPKPDRLKGTTSAIIRVLGKHGQMWKHQISELLPDYNESTTSTTLHRLYSEYKLVDRDDLNLYSLSAMGSKYFEIMFEDKNGESLVPQVSSTTTTTQNAPIVAELEKIPEIHAQIDISESLQLYRSGTDQLQNSYTTCTDQLQNQTERLETPVQSPVQQQTQTGFLLKGNYSSLDTRNIGNLGSSSKKTFVPFNEGEKLSFKEAIKDWITESSPSDAEIAVVTGLRDFLLSQNKIVTRRVNSEEDAASYFKLGAEEFHDAINKLSTKRQAYFGTFSGQHKVGLLLEWTDLLRHGMWRPENGGPSSC